MEQYNVSPASDLREQGRQKFISYIQQWQMSVASPGEVILPSSLPSFSPVHLMVDAPLPASFFPLMSSPDDRGEGCQVPNTSSTSAQVSSVSAAQRSTAVKGTGIVHSPLVSAHRSTDTNDYERPARTEKTIEHLSAVGLLDCCVPLAPRKVKSKELRLVHTQEHIDYVDQISFFVGLEGKPSCSIGQDLYGSEGTSDATRVACGCVTEAAKAIVRGTVRNAYAIVRPPGHHAAAGAASGFCFFNNAAVAARVAQSELKRLHPERYKNGKQPRVLIFDWDVHHCDGTENIFYEDPSVLVISVHQYGNGRGHVMRKRKALVGKPALEQKTEESKPSETSAGKEDTLAKGVEISADELAQLVLGDLGGSHRTTSQLPEALAQNTTDKTSNAKVAEEPSNIKKADTDSNGFNPLPRRAKRARAEVDYNKLADELGADDAIAAEAFGVALHSLKQSGSSSSSSSSDDGGESFDGSPRKLAGDSEGVSDDDNGDGLRPAGAELEAETFYPGTGHTKDIGGDLVPEARGRNINIACPTTGMGDLEYLQVVHTVVVPCGREYAPDLVIISCGFDSARGDLLGSMNLSPSGYYAMTKTLTREFGSVLVALEGGYHVSNVARCSEAVLRALLEESGTPIPSRSAMLWCQMKDTIDSVVDQIHPHWSCFKRPRVESTDKTDASTKEKDEVECASP